MTALTFSIKYAGKSYDVHISSSEATWGEVATAICAAVSLDVKTLKVLGIGKTAILPASCSNLIAGIKNGMKLMVLGSKAEDVAAVQSAKEDTRMPGFEYEELRAAKRRSAGGAKYKPPTGVEYTFGDYEVLQKPGLYPSPDHALQLLYRLASDPGIVAVMQKHEFKVGKLAEMPPEGLVGVDPVCVLGYNTNKGQSIHLRLRTDDLRGFRKYDAIRQTLCHELTHNVWGNHDNNFKALCSQLNKEVQQVDATQRYGGRHVLDGGMLPPQDDALSQAVDLHPAMAATKASSGKTLRQLAKESKPPRSPVLAASSESPHPRGSPHTSAVAVANLVPSPGPSLGVSGVQGTASISSREGTPGVVDGGVGSDTDKEEGAFEHFDAKTEELERRQRALEE